MDYRVLYSPHVLANIREHVRYLIKEQKVSPATIQRWYAPLFERIESLHKMPRLYAVDETATKRHGYEVHKLTYKKYVVYYTVNDDKQVVELIAFMHGAKRK